MGSFPRTRGQSGETIALTNQTRLVRILWAPNHLRRQAMGALGRDHNVYWSPLWDGRRGGGLWGYRKLNHILKSVTHMPTERVRWICQWELFLRFVFWLARLQHRIRKSLKTGNMLYADCSGFMNTVSNSPKPPTRNGFEEKLSIHDYWQKVLWRGLSTWPPRVIWAPAFNHKLKKFCTYRGFS